MNRKTLHHFTFALVLVCVSLASISAQEHAKPTAPAQSEPAAQNPQRQPVNPDTAASQIWLKPQKAVHAEEGEAHEENAEFKYSSMVAKLGHMIGLDAHGMYWVSIVVNFAVLAVFFWMLLKSKLPHMFRERTNTIQKALKEAQAASAEASRRWVRSRLASRSSIPK